MRLAGSKLTHLFGVNYPFKEGISGLGPWELEDYHAVCGGHKGHGAAEPQPNRFCRGRPCALPPARAPTRGAPTRGAKCLLKKQEITILFYGERPLGCGSAALWSLCAVVSLLLQSKQPARRILRDHKRCPNHGAPADRIHRGCPQTVAARLG